MVPLLRSGIKHQRGVESDAQPPRRRTRLGLDRQFDRGRPVAIDVAMREGASNRPIVKCLPSLGRPAVRNHRTESVTGLRRDPHLNVRGRRPPKAPALPAIDPVRFAHWLPPRRRS
jgi:hypothetical protein